MTESEIEIMTKARQLYPYIPDIINYDKDKQQLIVTKIEGEHIDEYIKRTCDLTIIDKLKTAINQLRSHEISLIYRYDDHYKQGYIAYHDYHSKNFIVDKDKNVWFIDWDTAGLYPKQRLKDDDKAIERFCNELKNLI